VCVPNDPHQAACADDGPNFDALGPCPDDHGPGRGIPNAVTLNVPVSAVGTRLCLRTPHADSVQ
jgi:hypothetical protein